MSELYFRNQTLLQFRHLTVKILVGATRYRGLVPSPPILDIFTPPDLFKEGGGGYFFPPPSFLMGLINFLGTGFSCSGCKQGEHF